MSKITISGIGSLSNDDVNAMKSAPKNKTLKMDRWTIPTPSRSRQTPSKTMDFLRILRSGLFIEIRRDWEEAIQILDYERRGIIKCSFCGNTMILTRTSKKYCSHRCQTAAAMRRFRAKM